METQILTLQFLVPMNTVQHIWKRARCCCISFDVFNKMSNSGIKKMKFDLSRIHNIPLHQQTKVDSLDQALTMAKMILFWCQSYIQRHLNAIKSFLKKENKRATLQFCISMFDTASIPHDPTFAGMYNIIHTNEKWSLMMKKYENYYLLPDEEDPTRTCKNKIFTNV